MGSSLVKMAIIELFRWAAIVYLYTRVWVSITIAGKAERVLALSDQSKIKKLWPNFWSFF